MAPFFSIKGQEKVMIEVRLFATFREGREKISYVESEKAKNGEDICRLYQIPCEEVAIFLINGRHSDLQQPIKDGDILALFPPVGGG